MLSDNITSEVKVDVVRSSYTTSSASSVLPGHVHSVTALTSGGLLFTLGIPDKQGSHQWDQQVAPTQPKAWLRSLPVFFTVLPQGFL